jgi:hypothetical protein
MFSESGWGRSRGKRLDTAEGDIAPEPGIDLRLNDLRVLPRAALQHADELEAQSENLLDVIPQAPRTRDAKSTLHFPPRTDQDVLPWPEFGSGGDGIHPERVHGRRGTGVAGPCWNDHDAWFTPLVAISR